MELISSTILATESRPLRELPGFGTLVYSPGAECAGPFADV
jgi:hypothetical protein